MTLFLHVSNQVKTMVLWVGSVLLLLVLASKLGKSVILPRAGLIMSFFIDSVAFCKYLSNAILRDITQA
jgi:hypothetical protein